MKCTFDIMDCKIQILGDQGCIYVCNKNVFTIYSLIQKQRGARIQMYSINALKK